MSVLRAPIVVKNVGRVSQMNAIAPYVSRLLTLSYKTSSTVVTFKDNVVHVLLELLFIRSGVNQLDNFSVSDVKVMIDSLCTC